MYIDKHVEIDEVVMVMGDWRSGYAKCGQHGCGQLVTDCCTTGTMETSKTMPIM